MSLVLRLQKGSALTNAELDANFIFLDGGVNNLISSVNTITATTIPNIITNTQTLLNGKQPLTAKLTSLSAVNSSGLISLDGSTFTPRSIQPGSANIVVTNGNGIDGNPSIDIASTVLTLTGAQLVSNKIISGNNNTISSISLTSSVVGVLPVANGGTNATTAEGARSSLGAMTSPVGTGIAVQTSSTTSSSRTIVAAGAGITVTNGNGVTGNPTITSNATSAAVQSTIVARDASNNFSANIISASLNGRAIFADTADLALVATQLGTSRTINGVSFDGTQNITIVDGTKLPIAGGTMTGFLSLFSNPTSAMHAATKDYVDGRTINGVTLGSAQSITITDETKLALTGGTLSNFITLHANPTSPLHAATKQYIDARSVNGVTLGSAQNITITDGTKLPTAGGAMSGFISLHADPTSSLHAATKQYVDAKPTVDASKLPLAGGLLSGFLTLHANPTSAMHAVTKQYVDTNALVITSGTMILDSSISTSGDAFPPAGKTISSLKGFLPAFGSSQSSAPSYSTNLMIVIDVSGSASGTNVNYNGDTYASSIAAAIVAAKYLVQQYATVGTTTVCVIDANNTTSGKYEWTDSAYAPTVLDDIPGLTSGTSGSVINAYNARPDNTAQTVVYFLSDSTHSVGTGSAFGGSEAAWKSFLNTFKIVSYGICLGSGGNPSNVNTLAYDGRSSRDTNGSRAQVNADLPIASSPGLYNTSSIAWGVLSDRVRVSITQGSTATNVSVNYLAFWS